MLAIFIIPLDRGLFGAGGPEACVGCGAGLPLSLSLSLRLGSCCPAAGCMLPSCWSRNLEGRALSGSDPLGCIPLVGKVSQGSEANVVTEELCITCVGVCSSAQV